MPRQAAANSAAPAPSATLGVHANTRASLSELRVGHFDDAADVGQTIATASGVELAAGHAVAQLLAHGRFDHARARRTREAGACADTTPTIFVCGRELLRAAAAAQMPGSLADGYVDEIEVRHRAEQFAQ